MAAITGDKAPHVPVPAWIAQTTAAIMEFVADHVTHRPPAATVEGVRIAKRSRALSIDKARRELGYAPRPIEPALREAIASVGGGFN
jgi:dihydroflavonol-4-reductase